MKKTIFLTMALGAAVLVSCSNPNNKPAAEEFCECYKMATSAADAETMTEMIEIATKANTCVTDWQAKYKGKIDKEGFSEELKQINKEAYDEAKKRGVL